MVLFRNLGLADLQKGYMHTYIFFLYPSTYKNSKLPLENYLQKYMEMP